MSTDTMSVSEFDELKNLLTLKYAQRAALEDEIDFLKRKFKAVLQFRDENDWTGKTDYSTFKMKESYRLIYPGNSDLDKKREFYTYMQKKDRPWFQQSVTLNFNAVNAYANTEIEETIKAGGEWEAWPHCKREENIDFGMRVRPGVKPKLYDQRVKDLGFGG